MSSSITKRDVLAFIFRYKFTVLGWWLFIVAVVGVFAFLKDPGYRAEGSILVERTKSPVAAARDFLAPERDEAMNTEVQILKSRPVLEQVVETLDLDQPPSPPEGAVARYRQQIRAWMIDAGLSVAPDPREGWIDTLQRELEAKPVVDSSVLTVRFSNKDPRLAMEVVNAATDAYIAHRRSVYSAQGLGAHFRTRMEEAEEELNSLRDDLAAFKDANAATSVTESRAEIVRETGRLRERIATLRAARTELRTRYARSHPQVLAANQNIAAAESALRRRSEELTILEQHQATLDEMGALISSQEGIFLDYKRQYEQERAREEAPENFVNSRVIAYATLPSAPRFSRLFMIKVGLVGGFVFAFLIACVREYFNNRITSPDEAERALGVPVLASIPKRASLARG